VTLDRESVISGHERRAHGLPRFALQCVDPASTGTIDRIQIDGSDDKCPRSIGVRATTRVRRTASHTTRLTGGADRCTTPAGSLRRAGVTDINLVLTTLRSSGRKDA